ncbi:MAG TPA: bifunctional demethylmenaquinone methyltransferase/2-methoxy-6-polyprenyl-1,4-benzoquinol methylase UbiE [Chryseosolibacter sp.]|nr:bifunctional demethylmenaquinone methyltransferase/2-methoxy-6-polyprenyl-1,4-benzoquinol methylase UbiE [Chryseosolibacter sp.]
MAVLPYKSEDSGKKEQIAKMFNNISFRYDFLNHFLSLGIDRLWRKTAIRMLRSIKPRHILDVATGTGDFAIQALSLNPEKVTGIDISEGMLSVGRRKVEKLKLTGKIDLVTGDSENLQFPDDTFDAVTVGFGVRNFEDLVKGLTEIRRVLKKDGMLVVLEFSKPAGFPMRQLYNFYFRNILPGLGRLISKDRAAYTYLPESVEAFPDGMDFENILRKVGFKETSCRPLTFGISSIYTGRK